VRAKVFKILRVVGALILSLVVVLYLAGIVDGDIPKENRLGMAELTLFTLAIFGIFLLFRPEALRRVRACFINISAE